LAGIGIAHLFGGKALALQHTFDLLEFTRHTLQIRPTGRVIAHADEQGVALAVEPDLLSSLIADQYHATLLSAHRAPGEQRQQDHPMYRSHPAKTHAFSLVKPCRGCISSNGLSQTQAYAIDLQLAKCRDPAIVAIQRGQVTVISQCGYLKKHVGTGKRGVPPWNPRKG